jgi:hypothetical protein
VLFTCSAFAPAIEAAAMHVAVRVLKPDEAMFDAALQVGVRIGMLASFAPAVASTEAAFRQRAHRLGRHAEIDTHVVGGAWQALRSGDVPLHDRSWPPPLADLLGALRAGRWDLAGALLHVEALPLVRNQAACAVFSTRQGAVAALKARLGEAADWVDIPVKNQMS